MSDNLNTSGVGLSTITQLIQLLASYGVYALVIIFMVYQQQRARLALKESKDVDRPYYQRQNTIVLWTTIGLSLLSAAVWIFTAFVYQPRLCIEGTIKDLTEQPNRPTGSSRFFVGRGSRSPRVASPLAARAYRHSEPERQGSPRYARRLRRP